MSLINLANQYAKLKKTKVIAHREEGNEITFVLESGPKITMTQSQLELAISNLEPQAGTVAGEAPAPTKRGKAAKEEKE